MTWTVGRGPRGGIPPAAPAPTGPYGNGAMQAAPTQPLTIAYRQPPSNTVDAYARPGGLIIAAKQILSHSKFQAVSLGGGTVLGYFDPIIYATGSTYHDLLWNSNAYGPAVGKWPGPVAANEWGDLADFRPSSPMHQPSTIDPTRTKLEVVLEKMITDNPHLGGIFFDDTGSRSWFPNLNWATFGSTNQQAYRDGAILCVQTGRRVCDRHGLGQWVNGTWQAGTLAAAGGGYPDLGVHGLSLAEGGFIENATYGGSGTFWHNYALGPQWATATPGGTRFMLSTNTSDAERDAWIASGTVSHAATSVSGYGVESAPWGAGHATGLPSKAVNV